MIAERESQTDLEREIAARAKPLSTENNGVGDDGAEASAKPDPTERNGRDPEGDLSPLIYPTERNGRDPEGDLSPLIYPTGWHDKSKRLGFNFKRIKIRGKPLSETVMEDRRAGW